MHRGEQTDFTEAERSRKYKDFKLEKYQVSFLFGIGNKDYERVLNSYSYFATFS